MTTWAQQIQPHRGASHTLRALDTQRLLCSCGDVLIASDPTPSPAPLHAADRCPDHPGQRAGACGPCRAEQLEAQRTVPSQPTADVAAGVAAARAALAQVAARRRSDHTQEQP